MFFCGFCFFYFIRSRDLREHSVFVTFKCKTKREKSIDYNINPFKYLKVQSLGLEEDTVVDI